jgi:competence protein ComEC
VIALALVSFGLGAIDARARMERGTLVEAIARRVPLCRFDARVMEAEGGLGTLTAIETLRCDDGTTITDPGLVWLDADAPPGARVSGEGWMVPLGTDGFGRARRRYGAGAELAARDVHVAPPDKGWAGVAQRLRLGLVAATSAMSPRRAALLAGLTTGDTSRLDESTTEEFRAAGLSHVVAVSGQNVAMVVGALALITRSLAARPRALVATAAVALFVLVVGPQPSVLRAGAMAVLVVAALGAGAAVEPWHVFGAALAAVLSLRPAILFSAGLHLSAAATAGLLLWARPLARRLGRLPSWIALGLAATIAAQVAVTPLVGGLFGNLSIAAPVANVLALPAIPPATVLGLCAAIAGAFAPGAGRIPALLAEPFVAWVLGVAHIFGGSSWAAVEIPRWSAWPLGAAVAAAAAMTVATSLRDGCRQAAGPQRPTLGSPG